MAKYSIQAPNGKTYQIDGPDGASDDEVRSEVMRQYPDASSATPPPAAAAKKPATFLSTLGRAAYNLPMDTAETLKGSMQQFGPDGLVAQTVMHPVKAYDAAKDFAHKAADILTGGMQHVREMSASDSQGDAPKMDTGAYDEFATNVHDKIGTKQGIYKTVGDHPAGTILAAASILDPALKAGGIDVGKNLVGGVNAATDAIKTKLPPPRVVPPTVSELKKTSGGLYEQAKKAGVVINGQSYANFADDARSLMDSEGIDPTLHPKTTAALKRITDTGGDVTLNKLETLRKITGDATNAVDRSDKRLSRLLLDHLDDYRENLEPQNILAGDAPKAIALLNQARDTWKNAARGETIDKLIAKAKQNSGLFKTNLDAAYRTQFKKLANNDRGMVRFTPDQQDAIRKVAFGDGPVQGLLHAVGRIIPSSQTGVLTTSGMAGAAHLAGMSLTGPVAMGVGGVGLASKAGSTLISAKNAQRASELARSGSKITPRSDAYYQIQKRRSARNVSEQ